MYGVYKRDRTNPATIYEKGSPKRRGVVQCLERMGRMYDNGTGYTDRRYEVIDVETQLFTVLGQCTKSIVIA